MSWLSIRGGVRTFFGSALSALLALTTLAVPARAGEYGGVSMIVPGMNQTELQAIMGPPDYIQVKRLQQAWQYCPRLFDGRDEDLFITVWLDNGRVKHMRAYPEDKMGSCQDFFAAFRWEDAIDGAYADSSGNGLQK